MISVLLNIFDSRSSLLKLIRLMIDREVAQTGAYKQILTGSVSSNVSRVPENESGLFRSNSTCTRFLSAFARLHGYQYLRSLVEPLITAMRDLPDGSGYEMNPDKVSEQDILQNQKNVEHVASTFLDLLSSSLPALPGYVLFNQILCYIKPSCKLCRMFREICAHIAKVV